MIRLDSDLPKRMQALTTIPKISHTFDAIRKTSTFPAGYNVQNTAVHAQENALSGLLTKLDAVEVYGFKFVREVRKVSVGELEKVIQVLGVGEGRGEAMDKDEVKESSCRGYSNGRSSLCRALDASKFPRRDLPTRSRSRPAKSNISAPQTIDRTTEPTFVSDPIGTPHPIVEEPPTTDQGNAQDDGKWTPN